MREAAGQRAFVAGALLVFAALAVHSMRVKNPTFDETAHLAAGISYVQAGDFRMNPEHPALPKALAGAAASLTGVRMDETSEAWQAGEQWDFGRELLYGGDPDWRRIVFAGRLPMVAIGLLLGLVIWVWGRAMAGPWAAGVALVLYALSPNFLAHTRLVTTDVPLTLSVVGAAACLWAAWRTDRLAWTLGAAGFVALSMATKFSAFSYAPVWAVLAVLPSGVRSFRRGLVHAAVLAGAGFLLTELVLFVVYGFATDWTTIRSIGMVERGVVPSEMGLVRRIPYEIMASIPWPSADFAEGMRTIITYTEAGHPVYALGRRADAGWWWTPFLAWGTKTPVPFLVLTVTAIVTVVRSPGHRRGDLAFLLLPPVLVLGSNVAAKLGLGVRHVLPMFPFLMLFAAWPLRGGFRPGPRAGAALIVLLLWQAAGTLRAHPHYLPYFNEIAGGAKGGYRLLGDSNLDWGQDLSAAAAELKRRGADGAILCYFGTANPFVEDLEWQILPPAQRGKSRDPWTVLPAEGPQWLAMSATNRQGVYYRVPGGGDPYPWLEGVEPEAVVGGSIFLYEIGRDADVQLGLVDAYRRHGLLEEAENALERVVAKRRFDVESRRLLASVWLAKGDSLAVDELIAKAPNPEPEEILLLTAIREARGDREGALRMFELGLKGFKRDPEFRNEYAWYLQENDIDLDRALEVVNEALAIAPEDLYFLDTRAMVRLKRGETWDALADVDAALARPDGDLPAIRWHRVQILDALGRGPEAHAEAKRLLERDDLDDELRGRVEIWRHER